PDEIDVRSGVRPRLRVRRPDGADVPPRRCGGSVGRPAAATARDAELGCGALRVAGHDGRAAPPPPGAGLGARRPPGGLRRGERLLHAGAALMSLSRTAAGVVGPAVGGTLVALISPGVAVAGDAATFLVSAGSLALLRLEWPAREAMGASMLTESGRRQPLARRGGRLGGDPRRRLRGHRRGKPRRRSLRRLA